MPLQDEVRKYRLYGEEPDVPIFDFVHLEAIGTRARFHNWVIATHLHPGMVQLLYLDAGTGVLIADGEDTALPSQSVVLVPRGAPHAFRFGTDTRGKILSVAEPLLHEDRLAIAAKDRFLQRNRPVVVPLGADREHARMVRMLLAEIDRRCVNASIAVTDTVCAALSLLFSLVEEAAGALHSGDTPQTGPRRTLFHRFMQSVEQSYREHLSVADYADTLGTSQATLTRACREAAGKAPGALIDERRMLEARRALSLTSARVSEIAADLGYDPAYFARCFRRHAGLTASDFRRTTLRPVPTKASSSRRSRRA